MTDDRNVIDQPVKNDIGICKNVRKIIIEKRNDYKAVLFLDYSYFKSQVYSHKFK